MTADMLDLIGQVALVTGGGGGIGRAIALALAERGADVTIVDIVPERCAEVAARIAELGRAALPFPADVMQVASLAEAVAATETRFGRLDILVNNAGGVTRRSFLDLAERNWRRHIELNLVSAIAATSAAVPLMIRGGRGGAIINVTSIEGTRAAPGFAVYGACKAGLINLTQTWALEFGEHNIRVNAISPDMTVTPGTQGNHTGPVDEAKWRKWTSQDEAIMQRRYALMRPGIASECGRAALFLASPMSSYVTGVTLPVDGGSAAQSGWTRNQAGSWVLGPEYPSVA